MKKKLYQCYVGFVADAENHIKYVTDVDYLEKSFRYDAGKPAEKFTETSAKDLVFGMVCNGYPAFVIKAPTCLDLANNAIDPA